MTTVARRVEVPTADDMRRLGESVGRACEPGDVVLLIGDLGAGKTTFAQGVASGLGIGDPVTSPTFVIARSHRHPAGGPDLVHVDAYRLGGGMELDDLDLESDLSTSVVVVEWGEGIAERLSDARLEIRITRPDDDSDEVRYVELVPLGDRWAHGVGSLT